MEEKKTFREKITAKYRLSVYRDASYEEVINFRLTRLNVFLLTGTSLLVLFIGALFFIGYTPVRELIPGYPNTYTRFNIVHNKILIDSLAVELEKRDNYIRNINLIILGREPESYENERDTETLYENIDFSHSREDSLLREMFDHQDIPISVAEPLRVVENISATMFFPPVRGMITNSFNPNTNHYGTDVVAAPNEVVKSTLAGTVIFSDWTIATGNVIEIQHDNNLISIYKHNAELLKRVGDYVKVGEPIAIIGNSGEMTTGTHLHFELWHNKVPLNPEDYISF